MPYDPNLGYDDQENYFGGPGADDYGTRNFQPQPTSADLGKVYNPVAGGGRDIPDFGSYSMPTFGISGPSFRFSDAPEFRPTSFRAPTLDEAVKEPGYQFRLNSGTDALQKSAAARGVLRSGGTLKNLVEYGQNFATSEYNNVYDRALRKYNVQYQGEKDAYMPKFQEWMFLNNAERDRGLAEYQGAQNLYGLNLNAWQRNEDRKADIALDRR